MKKVLIVVVILLALGFVYMMIQAQEKASRSLESQVPDTKVYQKVDLEEGPDLSSYDGEYFLDVDASTLGWS